MMIPSMTNSHHDRPGAPKRLLENENASKSWLCSCTLAQALPHMSFKASFDRIPGGTLVNAYGINGNLVAKWNCKVDCDLETASLALMASAAATLNAPRQSIHLVWAPLEQMTTGLTNADPLTTVLANVELILTPLMPYDSEFGPPDFDACFMCKDPCEDVDDFIASRTRGDNCIRCCADYVCDNCHVRVPRLGWVCFDCLEPTEMNLLNASQSRRYQLSVPNFGDKDNEA